MKKIFTLVILVMLVLTSVGCDKKVNMENGDLVTFKDKDLTISINDLYEVLKEKYGTNQLIDMIDTKILNKEYATNDTENAYVDIQINSLKNYYKTETEFLEYIHNYGYQDENELRDYFHLNYKRNLAVYDYLESLLTDKDIQKYYDEKITGDVTGSHILIEVSLTDSMSDEEKASKKEEAYKKASEAISKLDEGTSFEEVAKEYSNDSKTKNDGGKMGTFNVLDLDDVTRQEYTNLKVSEYSKKPVETEYGYEIFLKESEKDKPKLESVKKRIIKILADEKLNSDTTIQQKGIMAMREKYGFKIQDEDLKVYYANAMNNLLKIN